MTDLDQWADARKPAGEEASVSINAEDLAQILVRAGYSLHGREAWGAFEDHVQRLHVRAAERVLVEVGARDLSDPQRALIARIQSAGDRAASEIEDCASMISTAVDEALGTIGLNVEAPRVEGWCEGVRYVVDELDAHSLADPVAGTSRLDDALRAFLREARQKEAPA